MLDDFDRLLAEKPDMTSLSLTVISVSPHDGDNIPISIDKTTTTIIITKDDVSRVKKKTTNTEKNAK